MRTICDRLSEVREGLGLSQKVMAERCGVSLRSQQNYESGERLPDAAYLTAAAAAGADVLYILTGSHDGPAPVALTAEEQTLLAYFRDASKELRKAALGVLLSGTLAHARHVTQTISAPNFGDVAGGNIRKSSATAANSPKRGAKVAAPGSHNTQIASSPGAVQIIGSGNSVRTRPKK